MIDVQKHRDADMTTPRPEKKQRTEPPQKEEESKKETAQEFVLVRRGDAGSSNPEWCAQRYGCIAYLNEKARDEDALQELIAPLLKESTAGTAVVRALVGALALALHYTERENHAGKQGCEGCAWKKCDGPLCHEMLHKDENCACGFGSAKGA